MFRLLPPLLRVRVQDPADMTLIVNALKQKLAPFGWAETVRRDVKGYSMSAVSALLHLLLGCCGVQPVRPCLPAHRLIATSKAQQGNQHACAALPRASCVHPHMSHPTGAAAAAVCAGRDPGD